MMELVGVAAVAASLVAASTSAARVWGHGIGGIVSPFLLRHRSRISGPGTVLTGIEAPGNRHAASRGLRAPGRRRPAMVIYASIDRAPVGDEQLLSLLITERLAWM
jgi:hypothetical protein